MQHLSPPFRRVERAGGLPVPGIAEACGTYPQRVRGAIERVERAEPLLWQPEAAK